VPAEQTVLTAAGLDGRWLPWRPARAAADTEADGDTEADSDTSALAELILRGPERIALTGPNGAGKTTLLRIIAGQLLADPPPQFLLLDEPTNSLDLTSARQLAQALSCYRGALLAASHDIAFLARSG
jgi:ATPase subunit of ABC transporter with duplicated ATPase domains